MACKVAANISCAALDGFSKHVNRRHISNSQKPSKAAEFPACNQSEILTAAVLQAAFLGVGSLSPHSLSLASCTSFGPLASKETSLASFFASGRCPQFLRKI